MTQSEIFALAIAAFFVLLIIFIVFASKNKKLKKLAKIVKQNSQILPIRFRLMVF